MHYRTALWAAMAIFAGAAHAEDWQKSFPLTGRAELRVDAKDGAVTVRSWNEKSISARVTTMGWKLGPGELEVFGRQDGNRVEVSLKLPSMRWNLGRRSIHVEVQVPRDTRLDIRTGDGSIRVNDVEGELRLTTGDGSITAEEVSGTLQARTGDGRIHVRGKLDSLNLHTGDGSVTAEILPGAHVSTSWRVETGDGSVTLRLPGDLAADIDARTRDGHLSVDFPLSTTSERAKNAVKARLNAGGPTITIRTGDGSVNIGRI